MIENVYILSLFPEYFKNIFNYSILKRKKTNIKIINYREFSDDKFKKVDDYPYGGGPGMILKCQPIIDALNSLPKNTFKILLCPKGIIFNQNIAKTISNKYKNIALICGCYEGYDARIYKYVDLVISLGNFITTSGEPIASVIINTLLRLNKNILKEHVINEETNFPDFVEYDQYTRPREYNRLVVPEILLSGNHLEIQLWKKNNLIMNKKKWDNYKKNYFKKIKF